jgi:hypothetical protein
MFILFFLCNLPFLMYLCLPQHLDDLYSRYSFLSSCVPYLGADYQISASFKSFSICNMYMFNKTATLQELIFLYVYRLGSCCFLCEVYVITLTFLYAVRSLLFPKFMNLWACCLHIVIVVPSLALTFANFPCELLHDKLPNGLLHFMHFTILSGLQFLILIYLQWCKLTMSTCNAW